MTEIYLPRQDMLDRLGISCPLFRKLRKEGAPDPRGAGKASTWPLYAWAEWCVRREANGSHSPELTMRAAAILRQRDGIPEPDPTPPPAIIEPEVLGPDPDVQTITDTPGLEHALERLRLAEILTFQRWKSAVDARSPEAAILFREWKEALDLLRKAEKNLTDHLTTTRDLLPAHEVREWMTRQLTAAKATMLNLPGKLAPQLEGKPWPKIQKKLEEEMRYALGKMSAQPE